MGTIAKILNFTRTLRNGVKQTDVLVNPGGGMNKSITHYAPIGDDSFPIIDKDYCLTVDTPWSGGQSAAGYLDPETEQLAEEGEKRIYSRKSDGSFAAHTWLKADGTILISNEKGIYEIKPDGSIEGKNDNGYFKLEAGGDFVVNGAVIDTTGKITSPIGVVAPSMVVNGKELDAHDHLAGTPPGDTGPNN